MASAPSAIHPYPTKRSLTSPLHPQSTANTLLNALKSKSKPLGTFVTLPGASIARTVARLPFQWILVDCEHGDIDDAAMHVTVNAIHPYGPSPIVRLMGGESWMIKRALDTGAHGVLVPMVESQQQALSIVQSAKFPPTGTRGQGSAYSSAGLKMDMMSYIQRANNETMVVCQIESRLGLDNCDLIAGVDGVDAIFIGPNDLAVSLGFSRGSTSPIVESAIESIRLSASKAGKYAGILGRNGTDARKRFEQGFDFVGVAADWIAITEWMGNAVKEVREG